MREMPVDPLAGIAFLRSSIALDGEPTAVADQHFVIVDPPGSPVGRRGADEAFAFLREDFQRSGPYHQVGDALAKAVGPCRQSLEGLPREFRESQTDLANR